MVFKRAMKYSGSHYYILVMEEVHNKSVLEDETKNKMFSKRSFSYNHKVFIQKVGSSYSSRQDINTPYNRSSKRVGTRFYAGLDPNTDYQTEQLSSSQKNNVSGDTSSLLSMTILSNSLIKNGSDCELPNYREETLHIKNTVDSLP